MLYHATFTWHNYTESRDYFRTVTRNSYKDLLESVEEYLHSYEPRNAELETCACESYDGEEYEDITNKVKVELGYEL